MLDALPNTFRYDLARALGLSDRRLRGLVADGALERLGHGVYRRADAPLADLDRIELAVRAPEATLCLTSALALHDLTDAIPSVIDVALPRGALRGSRPLSVGIAFRRTRSSSVGRPWRSTRASRLGSTAPNAASSTPSAWRTAKARTSPLRR